MAVSGRTVRKICDQNNGCKIKFAGIGRYDPLYVEFCTDIEEIKSSCTFRIARLLRAGCTNFPWGLY